MVADAATVLTTIAIFDRFPSASADSENCLGTNPVNRVMPPAVMEIVVDSAEIEANVPTLYVPRLAVVPQIQPSSTVTPWGIYPMQIKLLADSVTPFSSYLKYAA